MMPPNDPYEAWIRHRADVPVPEGFAGRLMAEVRRRQRPLFGYRAACLAACSLAGAVGLCRVLQVVVPFLIGHACM
jgi:hypothetical protein